MGTGDERPSGVLPPPPTPRVQRGLDRAPPPPRTPGAPGARKPMPTALGGFSASEYPTNEQPTQPSFQTRASVRPKRAHDKPIATQVEPTVLVVGATEAFLAALEPALGRHHVYVERSRADDVLDNVVATAPDLVLLVGAAAADAGTRVLERLASSPHSSVVPVALLGDDAKLEERLRAFRHGAAAVIPKTASIDAIAERVASLAREIPDRDAGALGDVGEATLHEFVTALSKELRTGILTVQTGDDKDPVRLVLGAGRPLSDAIEDFVSRVRHHVLMAEPLRYEFDERAGGTVQLLGADASIAPGPASEVDGLRILLADDDAARADAVAQELRDRGITVVVTDLEPTELRFQRLRQLDPAILLIGEEQAQGDGYELMRAMRRDTRLRWSSLLVVRWGEVWTEESDVPAVNRIIGTLAALAEPEHSARDRATAGVTFDTRLEIMGPARLLRALAASSRSVRVSVNNPRIVIQVDLSDNLVVGAVAHTLDEAPVVLEGSTALAALLVLSSGRVRVEPVEQPATANLMSTVDVALNLADDEPPPIAPSMPVPPRQVGETQRPPAPAAAPLPDEYALPQKQKSTLPWILGAVVVAVPMLIGAAWLVMRTTEKPAPAAAATTPAVPAEPAPSASVAAQPSASAEPAKSAAPAKSAEPPPAKTAKVFDTEPREVAPTCSALLAGEPAPAGVYPGAAYAQLRAGRRGLVRGDLDEAERAYCRAVSFDPKNLAANVELARVLVLRRDGRAAADAARAALRIAPEDRNALLALGDALAMHGEMSDAREPLMRGSGVDPADEPARASLTKAQMQLAQRAARRREYLNEERFYRRAFALSPTFATAAAGVAGALVKQEKYDAALVWARRAAKLDPTARRQVLVGDVLAKSGDKAGARAAYAKAVKLDPADPDARARAMTHGN